MTAMGQSTGLRIIFSFFLGLMLTAFVGVGVYTFHPPPDQYDSEMRDLRHREQSIRDGKPSDELTAAERDEIQEIRRQRHELMEAAEEARKPWALSTSIILMVFATLAMVVSLVRADQLPVISNGILLGGVFTMLYCVGWIVATDSSVARFAVMTVALVVTLGLGYIRFVRIGSASSAQEGSMIMEGEGFAEIERRLRNLEDRMNQAAQALGDRGD